METLGGILIIIAYLLVFILILTNLKKKQFILISIMWIFLSIGSLLYYVSTTERYLSIDVLKGKELPYEMKITYELIDSVYVPKDTLFIKTK